MWIYLLKSLNQFSMLRFLSNVSFDSELFLTLCMIRDTSCLNFALGTLANQLPADNLLLWNCFYWILFCSLVLIFRRLPFQINTGIKKSTKVKTMSINTSWHIAVTSYWARWRLKLPAFDCLLNCLFRHRSKKTPKLRVTALCEGTTGDRQIPLRKGQ